MQQKLRQFKDENLKLKSIIKNIYSSNIQNKKVIEKLSKENEQLKKQMFQHGTDYSQKHLNN